MHGEGSWPQVPYRCAGDELTGMWPHAERFPSAQHSWDGEGTKGFFCDAEPLRSPQLTLTDCRLLACVLEDMFQTVSKTNQVETGVGFQPAVCICSSLWVVQIEFVQIDLLFLPGKEVTVQEKMIISKWSGNLRSQQSFWCCFHKSHLMKLFRKVFRVNLKGVL